jgi:hypothetical protein
VSRSDRVTLQNRHLCALFTVSDHRTELVIIVPIDVRLRRLADLLKRAAEGQQNLTEMPAVPWTVLRGQAKAKAEGRYKGRVENVARNAGIASMPKGG